MGDAFAVFGDLSDGGPLAALGHAVGTAEVEFKAIDADILNFLDDFVPGFLGGGDHDGGDDGVVGEFFFDLGDFLEVVGEGAIGDEFDVVEAHEALVGEGDSTIAGGDVDDGVVGEGFPDCAAPAGAEGVGDLVGGVGGRSAGEPEGVGGFDSGAVD